MLTVPQPSGWMVTVRARTTSFSMPHQSRPLSSAGTPLYKSNRTRIAFVLSRCLKSPLCGRYKAGSRSNSLSICVPCVTFSVAKGRKMTLCW